MRIVRDGLAFIIVPALIGGLLLVAQLWVPAVFFLLLAAFMAFFFRDPQRQAPSDAALVVSPADGKVTTVKQTQIGEADSPQIVSIFLSPLDVHINRAPIAGTIMDVTYTKGKFLMATTQNASLVNEQNVLTIQGELITVVCKQIAGILARRIVCWKKPGDKVALGERFGLIKFGSRTDLVLPASVEVLVKEGMRVKGGTSIIGRIR
ncbi:MAG TPA: phosphatidylserine decarboxylase family protein [Pyrinomonadaceae bacterium]|nr:phosphatidylserine decarboxylase family protein [Pyrinomonadaceae bacterium]